MNDLEFQIQYKRIKECHPFIYGSKEKMETIWKFVHDMDEPWFRKMVDNICAAPDARSEKYDIGAAVVGEKRARKSAEFAENVVKMSDLVNGRISEKGLGNVLEQYGASNLVEAIERSRKGEL